VQGTSTQAGQHVLLDKTDIRYADTIKLADLDVLYGIDVDNNPTVQDVWNTVPAWSYPFVSPSLAPAYSPPGTMIEGAFASRTVGTGGYLFLQDLVYVEASAYHNLANPQLDLFAGKREQLGDIPVPDGDWRLEQHLQQRRCRALTVLSIERRFRTLGNIWNVVSSTPERPAL
jgi:hypothetical protein